MSGQRRGGGRRGGGLPSTAPPQGPRGGRRCGGRGPGDDGQARGRGFGGGGGGSGSSLPYLREEPVPPVASHCPPSAPSSFTSAAVAPSSSLSGEIVRSLTISDSSKDDEAKEVEAVAAPPPASKKSLRHPPRPGFGTAGKRCVVRANHFLIEVADKDLFHYDLSVTPEPKSQATNEKVISELVKLHKDGILGKRIPAYDGRKSLYTAGSLPFEVKDFPIKFPETSQRPEKEFKVTIRHAGHPSIHNLREFFVGKQIEMPQDVIQVLDVVLRESPSSKDTSFVPLVAIGLLV